MRFIFVVGLIGVLTLLGCNRPPKPCIEMDQTTVSIGTPVTLTSCSKRALSYEWFMAGPTAAPENSMGWSDEVITHSFSIAGDYTITLNVYNKFGYMGDMTTTTTTLVVQ